MPLKNVMNHAATQPGSGGTLWNVVVVLEGGHGRDGRGGKGVVMVEIKTI